MKVFGLQVQFLAVALASSALFIYLLAATAESRVEARTLRIGETSAGQVHRIDLESVDTSKEPWESAFLFVCPLH